jgi:hypothetical protein
MSPELDRSVKIARSSFPSGVTNYVGTILEPTTRGQLSRRLCVDTGQTGGVDRSNRSPGDFGDRPPNVAQAGSRRGDALRVALGLARLAFRRRGDEGRTTSGRLEKLGRGESKYETNKGK